MLAAGWRTLASIVRLRLVAASDLQAEAGVRTAVTSVPRAVPPAPSVPEPVAVAGSTSVAS
jgi:hypothetical protein